jgi:hypothetical protein
MKPYIRNPDYWHIVRNCVLTQAQIWSRGSEARALAEMALGEDWLQVLMDHAPAGQHISPGECALIIVKNFLLGSYE